MLDKRDLMISNRDMPYAGWDVDGGRCELNV